MDSFPSASEEVFESLQELGCRFYINLGLESAANFMMGSDLPREHYPAFLRLTRENLDQSRSKETVYLSPLIDDAPSRNILFEFNQLKRMNRLPAFLYTIQRL